VRSSAKASAHRPRTAPALGLRAGGDGLPMGSQTASPKENGGCGSLPRRTPRSSVPRAGAPHGIGRGARGGSAAAIARALSTSLPAPLGVAPPRERETPSGTPAGSDRPGSLAPVAPGTNAMTDARVLDQLFGDLDAGLGGWGDGPALARQK
jgi:hypothetical protein